MPRPDDLDPELVAAWEADIASTFTPPPGLEVAFANPDIMSRFREADLAGRWLKAKLAAIDTDADKIDKFFVAFSQRVFQAPDMWGLAQKTIELYQKTVDAAAAAPTFSSMGLPEEERKALFEKYTQVHG